MLKRLLSLMCCLTGLSGCVVVDLGVTNPIPELTTVAVAPFFNLSHEPAVDGRRCAIAYYSELQKVPGFEVLPVGVAEMQIVEHKLQMNNPDDVLKLAKLLDVDAVVVGAITDYDPYYPPRIGWHVSWYSPRQWEFYPGIQTDPQTRRQLREWDSERLKQWREQEKRKDTDRAPDSPFWLRSWRYFRQLPGVRKVYREPMMVRHDRGGPLRVRAQSPESQIPGLKSGEIGRSQASGEAPGDVLPTRQSAFTRDPGVGERVVPVKMGTNVLLPDPGTETGASPGLMTLPPEPSPPPVPEAVKPPPPPVVAPKIMPDGSEAGQWLAPGDEIPPMWGAPPASCGPTGIVVSEDLPQANPYNRPKPPELWQLDPRQPLMTYTRMFDGANANLVATLRDYVELSGDQRSGGWEGYLHRSEDFIRFTAHLMIAEMLTLHGGEARRRIVLKHRNLK